MSELPALLRNDTIRFATEIPKGSPFVSLGRRIKILGPELPVGADLVREIPGVISLLDSPEGDWAANLFLYAVTERDALPLIGIENDVAKWRAGQKASDVAYWRKWWSENEGRLVWDGSRLTPRAE